MKSITAQATVLGLAILASTGCQSGSMWPFAKKTPPADPTQQYAATAAGAAAASSQPSVQLPSQGSQPYNVGNNYTPAGAVPPTYNGAYPEATVAAANAYAPGAAPSQGYGTASTYGTGTGYPDGGVASATPTGSYPSTGYPPTQGVAPQEGPYGNPAASGAANAYGNPVNGYAPNTAYGAPTANPYAGTGTAPPPTSAYPDPTSPYPPQTSAPAYPQTNPAAPSALTADSRNATGGSRYDGAAAGSANPEAGASAAPVDNRYGTPASAPPSSYPSSAYPPSSYPTAPPAASNEPYRPGGTKDFVPASPNGNLPGNYGATGSGVRPASFEAPATPAMAPSTPVSPAAPSTLNVVTPGVPQ